MDIEPTLTPVVVAAQEVSADEAACLFGDLADAPRVVLAVSGGPDSLALLLLMAQWRAQGLAVGAPRPALAVAVVDHGLRREAADEARMVMRLAAELGLDATTLHWAGPKPAGGLQQAARAARYELLFGHAAATGASHVATAHHADDNAETILMRLCAGSGLAGLAGMAPVSARDGLSLVRPLLSLGKARLIATCVAHGVAWANDPGNLDTRKGRGRVRSLAIDVAAHGLDTTRLLRLGARAARADAALEVMVNAALLQLAPARDRQTILFDMHTLAKNPEDIVIRVLARLLAQASDSARARGPRRAAPLERLERLSAALRGACASGEAHAATLAGALVRLDRRGVCRILPEAPRRRGRAGSQDGRPNGGGEPLPGLEHIADADPDQGAGRA